MNRLRIAVVGAGRLGKIHARLLDGNEDVDLVAIVEPMHATREALGHDFSCRIAESTGEVIHEIDAAVIATPTMFHHRVGEELLQNGIHVFVEKPITQTIHQAAELVELAAENRCVLQVGHVEQFNPVWLAARKTISEPVLIHAQRCSDFPFRSVDVSVVHDLMIHDIELVLSIVKQPVKSISASGFSCLTSTEDFAQASVEFENGCTANFVASRISDAPTRKMEILQTGQQVVLDFAARTATSREPHVRFLEFGGELDRCPADRLMQVKDSVNGQWYQGVQLPIREDANPIADEHSDFIECIHQQRTPLVSGEQGQDALILAEKIIAEIRRDGHGQQTRRAA